jgi:hypothetical protein
MHFYRLFDSIIKQENTPRVQELAPEAYFQRIPDPTFNIAMRDAKK